MGMLNYSSILPNFKANSAMDQLLYQLRSARERAIAHRREVQVQFGGNEPAHDHGTLARRYGASGEHCVFRRRGSVHSFQHHSGSSGALQFWKYCRRLFWGRLWRSTDHEILDDRFLSSMAVTRW